MDPLIDVTPEQQQRLLAEKLRGANANAYRLQNLNSIAPMLNNEGATRAIQGAFETDVKRNKPLMLGNQGVLMPETGEFVASPIYTEERNAQRQAAKDLQAERLAQQKAMQQAAIEAANQRTADSNALRLTLAAMGGDAARAREAERNKPKELQFSASEKLLRSYNVASGLASLDNSFKDNYVTGVGVGGDVANAWGRYSPLSSQNQRDRSNWWQNYMEQSNLIRNQLFGSALTKNEQAAFDAQAITPNMQASEVRRRLRQQHIIAARAYSKLRQSAGAGGQRDISAFEELPVPAEVVQPGGRPGQRIYTRGGSYVQPEQTGGIKILNVRDK
jgi:hypothetical protein